MDFLSFSEMVLGLQLGNRCDYSVPIFPEAFFGGSMLMGFQSVKVSCTWGSGWFEV